MIQRIQTVYLGISMILLIIVSSGITIFNFTGENLDHLFSVFGWTTTNTEGEVTGHIGYPLYLVSGVLILLIFLSIMSFKKLDRQLQIGRVILVLYFLTIAGTIYVAMTGEGMFTESVERGLGIGFLLLVLGFPFIFLANVAIKRDKKLLDSLNRLR